MVMGTEQQSRVERRDIRRALGENVAINVLYMHKFIRRGFFGRFKWLLFGR